ncbi:hypothetical protein RFI_38526, partial [Reticulomyxa filosa]
MNLLNISKINDAIELFHFVLCIRLQTLHDLHIDVAESYHCLGSAYYHKGEYDRSIEYDKKSLKIRLGDDHPDIATSYNNLGSAYANKGEYDKAIEYYEKSLEIRLNKLEHDHLY